MPRIIWDKIGERLYETGVRNGVLYPQVNGIYPKGVAWNGLTALNESPKGAESNKKYADDGVYLNLFSVEELEGSIEAYTYPDEFSKCDGSDDLAVGVSIGQQSRQPFGLSYRTVIGNDTEGDDYGYKLHLIYGAMASPSEKGYETINDSPDAITLSWDFTTTPVQVTGKKPTASLIIDSTKVDPAKLATLEDILYGTTETDARLPLPDEIAALFAEDAPEAITVTVSPDDNDIGVNIDTNIVFTFNNKIARESIIVMSDDGVIVEGIKSFDETGKILTFNPTNDLANDSVYLVTIIGVVDIYGQVLSTTVINFQTQTDIA